MFGTLHRIRLARHVSHATLKAFLPRQRAFMQQTGVAFVPVVSSDRADATFVGCVYFHLLEDVLHEFEELEAHRLTLTHTLTLSLTLTLTLSLSLALTLTLTTGWPRSLRRPDSPPTAPPHSRRSTPTRLTLPKPPTQSTRLARGRRAVRRRHSTYYGEVGRRARREVSQP